MKVLFVKPFGTDRYNSIMEKILNRVKRTDTNVTVTNLKRGPTYLDYHTIST